MEPILKWAGGKRQLLNELKSIIEPLLNGANTYFEPFIGGGSVAFSLEYSNLVMNDYNEELINVYKIIKSNPNELIELLKEHKSLHSKEHYYEVRSLDRKSEIYDNMSNIQKAARIIYLNKTCYNGLYRVNSKGFYNVPLGRSTAQNQDIVMEEKIFALSKYLNKKGIKIKRGDFSKAISSAVAGDVIYFDPPYDYEGDGFSTYNKNGFTQDDLLRLKKTCDQLVERGCHIIVSNNDTKFVRKCFSEECYKIRKVVAKRYINCDGKNRSKADEVIIYGYKQ